MRMAGQAFLVVMTASLLGCESTPAPQPPAVIGGPHSGTSIRLEGDKGFVELLNEPKVDARDSTPTALVVYYLQTDGKSPMSPAPTDVSLALIEGRSASKTVLLTPGSEGRFSSPPGPFNLEQLHGTLSATIGGQAVKTGLSGGR
jgi:hypothetical protein